LWLLCAVSLTLLFSAWLRGPAAAFLALLLAAGMSLVYSLLPSKAAWTPGALPGMSAGVLAEGGIAGGPIISAVVLIIICIAGASLLVGRNKLPK
jgi:ABC-2 type transport system permease protein